jgi:hypothetical protein
MNPKRRTEMTTDDRIFNDEEMDAIIFAALRGTPGGATEEDAQKLTDWCAEIRIKAEFVNLVTEGRLVVDCSGDEFRFIAKGNSEERAIFGRSQKMWT